MANEFVARKGLIVPGTGSINVISGSVTASNFVGTASAAISSSFATTASYSLSGEGFPYTGNAVITGSLNVTQAVTASYFKGDGSQLTNISAAIGQSALRVDGHQFEADGVTVVYPLSESIYTADDLIVSVGGVVYSPTIDYVFVSNNLVFTETPPSGSNITVRALVAVTSGSINVLSGSFSGSFFGTASYANNATSASYATTASLALTTTGTVQNAVSSSYAVTSSFASNVLKTKAGSVTNSSFGGTPLTASVTFSTAFDNTNYAIAITGEDSRAWVVQSKTASGFTINSVSSTALTGTTYWTCTAYGEN
jgi:hypothetical protein